MFGVNDLAYVHVNWTIAHLISIQQKLHVHLCNNNTLNPVEKQSHRRDAYKNDFFAEIVWAFPQ